MWFLVVATALQPAPTKPWTSRLRTAAPVAIALAPVVASTSELTSTALSMDAQLPSAFLQATSLIFLSEIGDKTFFIASILAAQASRIFTFVGAFGALVVMTLISVAIGQFFHAVPDSFTGGYPVDDYVAIASFIYFGIKSLTDALAQSDDDGLDDELKSAQEELAKTDAVRRSKGSVVGIATQAFALTVAAEVGDRSQISTIALSAAQNPYVVATGACLGHGIATGIAVLGGGLISKYVSEKGISLIAGTLFLVFALTTTIGLF